MNTIKRDEPLTWTNWVTIDGQPVKVSDLPLKTQQALGNRVRREPLLALGFVVEPVREMEKTEATPA